MENKQSLSFGQTGLVSGVETAKVSEVDVVEGQAVDQGQALVKADTKDWTNRITALKHQLDSAKANLVQAQASAASAQVTLATTQTNLATTQSGLATAQYNLATAQFNLKAQQDVKADQDKIDNANIQLQQAQVMYQQALQSASGDVKFWQQNIFSHQADIATYQKDLLDLLTDPAVKGVSVTDITTKVAQVQQGQTGVVQAQATIDQAQANLALAKKNIELTQVNAVVAQNAVDDAQNALTEEQNSAQIISAPFKGLITKVNVNQGDIIQRNANIIEIGQPDKFVANVLVTQRDVVAIKIGNDATVSFDALPDMSFPAKITQIASLATIQQGVVNYKVTVEITADAGNSQAILKDGFSAIVDIPVQKKDNILIVPSRAVSHQGQDYTVQLVSGTASETRVVTVGITDYQNTEIVSGLKPGDQLILPAIPTSTTNSGGMFGGG
jgi:multidrug efflux pump subunit AcrA (membrane-fusion protein)